ncbi:unnamed protein product [Cuscuta europaea]|uniref:Uncharacterized protein n=1 Tax=Cuscuta europaea TaxID=41803 RepID=A0A9P1E7N8_CUSEU|nr:unnamed protein product [Cuscuta europaea]
MAPFERLEKPELPEPEILVDSTNESDAGYVLIPCSNDVFFEDYVTFWWSREFEGLRHLTAYLEDKVDALVMSAPQLICITESSLSNVKLVTLKSASWDTTHVFHNFICLFCVIADCASINKL